METNNHFTRVHHTVETDNNKDQSAANLRVKLKRQRQGIKQTSRIMLFNLGQSTFGPSQIAVKV